MAAENKVNKGLITLTFGDMAENHKGMEQIGTMRAKGQGFHAEEMEWIRIEMGLLAVKCEMICLAEQGGIEDKKDELDAKVLVMRGGVNALLKAYKEKEEKKKEEKKKEEKKKEEEEEEEEEEKEEKKPYTQIDIFNEQLSLAYDKKAFMYGRVVNKHARWNLCFDEESRAANYEKAMGTIVGYNEVPIMKGFMDMFEEVFGAKAAGLKVESNYYYDPTKTGIGFHGDSERRIVIAARLGYESMPMHYQWFYKGEAIGERIIIPLQPGDMYIMSEKAVGTDWKMKNIPTLRHATGAKKFTEI
jgi:hypothetical protein